MLRFVLRPLGAAVGSLLLIALAHADDAPAKRRPIAVDDLYLFESVSERVASPSAAQAVFVRTWIDTETKFERQTLWVVSDKEPPRPLEKNELDSRRPVYSPDGRWIAFLSTRARPQGWKQIPPTPPESEAATDVWLIPAAGGTPVPLSGADKPYGRVFNDAFYARLAFSPDGKKLVFVADDGSDPRTPAELANDVFLVRPDQGESYTAYGPAQIWIAHLDGLGEAGKTETADKPAGKKSRRIAASKIERITKDDVWYGDPQWSPDGKFLVAHANKTADRESARFSINRDFDLFAIDLATRTQEQLTFGPGPDVSARFSKDGKKLAYLTIPRKGSHRDCFNLAILNLEDNKSRTLFDHHTVAKPGSEPHPSPYFPLPDDCWEDAFLQYSAQVKTGTLWARVSSVDGTGTVTATRPAPANKLVGLSQPVNGWLDERALGTSKVVTWKSDGMEIEGILTTPPEGKPPYKMMLFPHGGPHSRAALGFDFTVQAFAGAGYAVFEPNFRGSFGYGQKFIDADRKDLGGGDVRDILSGIDHLVKTGVVDPTRQFVFGSSYGGFLTTWLVGQTHQFRAAAAQNAVTDMHMMWALSDLPSWIEWEFAGYPWQVADALRKGSPITYVPRVKTPVLVIHSQNDRRVPLPLGLAYHRALLARNVPTQMATYPGEGHGIRQPRHREDVLKRVLAWFAKYEQRR